MPSLSFRIRLFFALPLRLRGFARYIIGLILAKARRRKDDAKNTRKLLIKLQKFDFYDIRETRVIRG